MKTPQQAAAEIAAYNIDSALKCHRAGAGGLFDLLQKAIYQASKEAIAWRPEVSERFRSEQPSPLHPYRLKLAEKSLCLEDLDEVAEIGFQCCYTVMRDQVADAAKREQELTEQLAEAQKRIGELERETDVSTFLDWAGSNNWRLGYGYPRALWRRRFTDKSIPLSATHSELYDLFRKETGR